MNLKIGAVILASAALVATSALAENAPGVTATEIKILVDGQLVHSVANSSSIPFNHNFFLIMNLAMGGNFGGAVDPSVNGGTMEVDYIRVYQ